MEASSSHASTLTYWRRRLAASEAPNRIFEVVRRVVDKTGVLAGRTRRASDSTVLDDAVATQDTVTQLIAAVRRVRRDVPDAAVVVAEVRSAHDYDDPGKPSIAWDDQGARAALVDALVADAHRLLGHLPDAERDARQAEALARLALVAGQDVEWIADGDIPAGGRWAIARRVAGDRIISVVDPRRGMPTRPSPAAEHDGLQRAHRTRFSDPAVLADYRAHRPMAERSIAWLTRGSQRLRYRGTVKNDAWLRHHTAALNLRRLLILGHPSDEHGGSHHCCDSVVLRAAPGDQRRALERDQEQLRLRVRARISCDLVLLLRPPQGRGHHLDEVRESLRYQGAGRTVGGHQLGPCCCRRGNRGRRRLGRKLTVEPFRRGYDIRDATRTSRSQLFHYFPRGKADLVRAVAVRQTQRVLEGQRSLLDGLDSLEALSVWRDAIVSIQDARDGVGGCPVGSLAAQVAEHDEQARQLLAQSFEQWRDLLSDVLVTLQQRGSLRSDADPDTLALATLASLQGGLLLAQTIRSAAPLATALDTALEHLRSYAA